jgi:hypothetical protein
MLSGAANQAGKVHAIATAWTPHGRRIVRVQQVFVVACISAVMAATTIGNRANRAAAHAESNSDRTLRQLSCLEQPINFFNQQFRQHGAAFRSKR